MGLFDIFKKHTEQSLPTDEIAYADASMIYTSSDFGKYNPDDLIGVKGHAVYKKMMRDEQVKAVVKFKRDAITSRDYIFELDHEKHGISKEEAEKRIDLCYTIIDKHEGSWMDSLNGMFSSVYNGYSMTEKVFGQIEFDKKTWWGIRKLKLRPYDTFRFKTDEYGNIEKVVQRVQGKEIKIDLSKFIHFVVNPDIDDHYGESDLRAAYRAYFNKDYIMKIRNIWLERHAGGFRWAQLKAGKTLNTNSAEYNTLKNVIQNIQTATGMIVPADYELNSDYPSNNVAFKEAIDDCNIDISRALLVPNLLGITPSGNTGSYSQSNTQLEAFLWTLEADSKRAEDVLNEQLFRQLASVNFGDDAWPRFKFNPISETKKNELITSWKDLVTAGAVTKTETDEAHIRRLLDFPEVGEDVADEGTDGNSSGDSSSADNNDTKPKQDTVKDKDVVIEETVRGKGAIEVSASFTKAQRRVDFAVIAATSDSITDEFTTVTTNIMDDVFNDLIQKSRQGGSLDDNIKDNMKELKVDKKLSVQLRKTQTAMLKESYSLGTKHIAFEIDKAKKTDFSRTINKDRLDFIANDYFKIKAFKITGNFTDEAIKIIENEILNGTKYDKTWAQVEKAIYASAASKGMISIEQAKAALGEALGVTNPDARIRTVIRTSSWDAINEARHAYSTDPDLDGYVTAFEYSAILDGRTTDICRHLDDENRGNHSVEWYAANPQYRPPNHYNCRSLLIPVTQDDEEDFVEGGQPTVTPQGGFR